MVRTPMARLVRRGGPYGSGSDLTVNASTPETFFQNLLVATLEQRSWLSRSWWPGGVVTVDMKSTEIMRAHGRRQHGLHSTKRISSFIWRCLPFMSKPDACRECQGERI